MRRKRGYFDPEDLDYYDPEVDLMDVKDFFAPDWPRIDDPGLGVAVVPPRGPTQFLGQRRPEPTFQRPGQPVPVLQPGYGGLPLSKRGVQFPTHPRMKPALRVAQARNDVVTSGKEGYRGDGVHSDRSLHYDGLAIDIRPARDRVAQVNAYVNAGYNVIDKPTHLHVSFDPEGRRL